MDSTLPIFPKPVNQTAECGDLAIKELIDKGENDRVEFKVAAYRHLSAPVHGDCTVLVAYESLASTRQL